METKKIISIQQFCTHYDVPVSFINELNEFGLVEIVQEQNTKCIDKLQIRHIEKMMRLHFDLDINMEGIDAIHNLLQQIDALQEQVTQLSNKLKFHEQL